jgi:hypothetical protein
MINRISPQYVCQRVAHADQRRRLDRRIAQAARPGIGDCGTTEVMAEAMLEIASAAEACTAEDLRAAGFTAEEICNFGEAASRRAARLSRRHRSA